MLWGKIQQAEGIECVCVGDQSSQESLLGKVPRIEAGRYSEEGILGGGRQVQRFCGDQGQLASRVRVTCVVT